MSKMNELYEKVAADSALQEKFGKIVEETANDAEAQGNKLVAFAKELGFEVTVEDIVEFFGAMSEPSGGELSEEDLDAVAGGKGFGFGGGGGGIVLSLGFSLLGGCGGGGGGGLNSVISFGGCGLRR